MSKKIKKQESKYHLNDMKMSFLASLVSGVDKHLKTPKGSIMFERLNDAKKNDQFRNHVLDEFSKRSLDVLDNIQHDEVSAIASKFQNKFVSAAAKTVAKVEKQGSSFDHNELLMNTFSSFEKVHAQLVDKL